MTMCTPEVEDALEQHVEETAKIGAGDAEHEPDQAAHQRAGEADDERGARAVEDAREEVAAELVGAEDMLPARRLGHRGEVVRRRAVGRHPVGADRRDDHREQKQQPERAHRLAPREGERPARG
jgi:hypothetical protein